MFKMEGDVMMYVVGGSEENEILLFGVILALRDALSILLKCVALPPSLPACLPSPSFLLHIYSQTGQSPTPTHTH